MNIKLSKKDKHNHESQIFNTKYKVCLESNTYTEAIISWQSGNLYLELFWCKFISVQVGIRICIIFFGNHLFWLRCILTSFLDLEWKTGKVEGRLTNQFKTLISYQIMKAWVCYQTKYLITIWRLSSFTQRRVIFIFFSFFFHHDRNRNVTVTHDWIQWHTTIMIWPEP